MLAFIMALYMYFCTVLSVLAIGTFTLLYVEICTLQNYNILIYLLFLKYSLSEI